MVGYGQEAAPLVGATDSAHSPGARPTPCDLPPIPAEGIWFGPLTISALRRRFQRDHQTRMRAEQLQEENAMQKKRLDVCCASLRKLRAEKAEWRSQAEELYGAMGRLLHVLAKERPPGLRVVVPDGLQEWEQRIEEQYPSGKVPFYEYQIFAECSGARPAGSEESDAPAVDLRHRAASVPLPATPRTAIPKGDLPQLGAPAGDTVRDRAAAAPLPESPAARAHLAVPTRDLAAAAPLPESPSPRASSPGQSDLCAALALLPDTPRASSRAETESAGPHCGETAPEHGPKIQGLRPAAGKADRPHPGGEPLASAPPTGVDRAGCAASAAVPPPDVLGGDVSPSAPPAAPTAGLLVPSQEQAGGELGAASAERPAAQPPAAGACTATDDGRRGGSDVAADQAPPVASAGDEAADSALGSGGRARRGRRHGKSTLMRRETRSRLHLETTMLSSLAAMLDRAKEEPAADLQSLPASVAGDQGITVSSAAPVEIAAAPHGTLVTCNLSGSVAGTALGCPAAAAGPGTGGGLHLRAIDAAGCTVPPPGHHGRTTVQGARIAAGGSSMHFLVAINTAVTRGGEVVLRVESERPMCLPHGSHSAWFFDVSGASADAIHGAVRDWGALPRIGPLRLARRASALVVSYRPREPSRGGALSSVGVPFELRAGSLGGAARAEGDGTCRPAESQSVDAEGSLQPSLIRHTGAGGVELRLRQGRAELRLSYGGGRRAREGVTQWSEVSLRRVLPPLLPSPVPALRIAAGLTRLVLPGAVLRAHCGGPALRLCAPADCEPPCCVAAPAQLTCGLDGVPARSDTAAEARPFAVLQPSAALPPRAAPGAAAALHVRPPPDSPPPAAAPAPGPAAGALPQRGAPRPDAALRLHERLSCAGEHPGPGSGARQGPAPRAAGACGSPRGDGESSGRGEACIGFDLSSPPSESPEALPWALPRLAPDAHPGSAAPPQPPLQPSLSAPPPLLSPDASPRLQPHQSPLAAPPLSLEFASMWAPRPSEETGSEWDRVDALAHGGRSAPQRGAPDSRAAAAEAALEQMSAELAAAQHACRVADGNARDVGQLLALALQQHAAAERRAAQYRSEVAALQEERRRMRANLPPCPWARGLRLSYKGRGGEGVVYHMDGSPDNNAIKYFTDCTGVPSEVGTALTVQRLAHDWQVHLVLPTALHEAPCSCSAGKHQCMMYPVFDGDLCNAAAELTLDLRDALIVYRAVLRGASLLRDAGSAHGDIKSQNVLATWRQGGCLARVALGDVGGSHQTAAWLPLDRVGWPASHATDVYCATLLFLDVCTGCNGPLPPPQRTSAGMGGGADPPGSAPPCK
eukprot:TRINITY_DN23637_c0_g1_i5.p1 TRINITY_DN23637_c0_g1~~TRINITY_DN23637_c0_g1_i5.p1  ORF type:complete len:1325 (+),score=223.09 TRINITY_DN23637_c0_g1_i5:79-4053(+)